MDNNQGHKMTCDHQWAVYSTALQNVRLLVKCVKCGSFGSIDDPSRDEWDRAFHAPSNPYDWYDNQRVTIRERFRYQEVERDDDMDWEFIDADKQLVGLKIGQWQR